MRETRKMEPGGGGAPEKLEILQAGSIGAIGDVLVNTPTQDGIDTVKEKSGVSSGEGFFMKMKGSVVGRWTGCRERLHMTHGEEEMSETRKRSNLWNPMVKCCRGIFGEDPEQRTLMSASPVRSSPLHSRKSPHQIRLAQGRSHTPSNC